ncbi:hypothetical protein DAI22_03g008800 [Oryza sativa Japonica Group]|uniref:Uncharacterized protein n=1 Tax=Oryza nivara TaxID=4536 RepID=A0A0E0J4U1_ORYNI|nr:hypothetical protein DAI22_03g008800 [Oryza sativa Japonica Group]
MDCCFLCTFCYHIFFWEKEFVHTVSNASWTRQQPTLLEPHGAIINMRMLYYPCENPRCRSRQAQNVTVNTCIVCNREIPGIFLRSYDP